MYTAPGPLASQGARTRAEVAIACRAEPIRRASTPDSLATRKDASTERPSAGLTTGGRTT